MIEIKDIEKLAELSRIKLSPAEKDQMRKEIVSILAYIDQIQQVSSEQKRGQNKENKELVRNVMREDGAPHESAFFTEVILKNAPSRQDTYIKVKKILNQ